MIRPFKASSGHLLLVWLAVLAVGMLAPRSAFAGEYLAKVVRQYALTSGNDFPQRDPQDWQLLGSSDDGKTWTALDVRKGELFPERHQRRVFRVAKPGAFKLYRLQINRVRNPAAADCVQLAELEPLGETEDDLEPAPLPEDRITAQGENPPLETRFQAFDNRQETKWLDHAAQNPATRASWIQWQYTTPASLVITNVRHLVGLRNRAGRGYSVRLEGVVAGRLPGTNALCFLDATGALELPNAGDGHGWLAGQRVLVEGTSRWVQPRVEIAQPRFQAQGPIPATEPRRLEPEQPMAAEDDLQWSEVEGKVQFCSWSENRLILELEARHQTLSVHVLFPGAAKEAQFAGAHVRVRGLCQGMLNGKGQRVAGILWTPSLDEVSFAGPTQTSPSLPEKQAPQIEVPTAPALLTTIEQIRRLSPEELLRRPRVKVHGVVTEIFGAYVQEETAGVEVWYAGSSAGKAPGFGSYIEIEGRGDWATGHGPIIRADNVVLLGQGKMPPPERCSWSQLASGRMVDQWVEIEAVVRATDGSHLLLNSEGGQLMATIRSAPAESVRQLVDAIVWVRGVSVAATDSRGRVQGIQLLVPSLEYVAVEQAAADPFSQPALPIGSLLQLRGPKEFIHRVRIEGMLTFREGRSFFLQDATGGAMAIAQGNVMLETPAGGWSWMFWQSASSNAAPDLDLNAGDHLQVVGFPEMRGYSPVLTEVLVRKVAGTNSAVPVRATVNDLAGGGLDSTRVSLEAELLGLEMLGPRPVLELQSGQRVFQAFLSAKGRVLPALAPGSRLRVTGVCQVEPLPYPELGKGVASFKLLVNSPADLVVLARPSWWTLKRALVAAGGLVVVLAIAGAWIGILRRQVEERTRQLQQEVADHERTEARLAEETRRVHAEIEERKRMEAEVDKGHKQLLNASRLAGMAEVATSVLHNVGNVLNSANVLASLIVEHVKRSKVSSVGRLGALLGEQRGDLGRFVTQDSRGKDLPGYVERLGAHLQQEQTSLLDKVRSLTDSIQHIKEIVAMQQNYAKVFGVLETVPLAEIVEDALRMHQGALARHQIQVVREYQPVPPVTVERHKMLQILFNLLENAKYACEDSGEPEKRVNVRIQKNSEARVQVEVQDNGVGIPAENLSRIFAQEFSTRKGGHGFGLHSSILAAQDMGASLKAKSDGPGKGAAFILEIPIHDEHRREGN